MEKMPTFPHAKVFECAAFVYNTEPKSKAHSRAEPGIFVGLNDHGVYLVELLGSKKLVTSVHVTFDEESFPALEKDSSSDDDSESSWSTDDNDEYCDSSDSSNRDLDNEIPETVDPTQTPLPDSILKKTRLQFLFRIRLQGKKNQIQCQIWRSQILRRQLKIKMFHLVAYSREGKQKN